MTKLYSAAFLAAAALAVVPVQAQTPVAGAITRTVDLTTGKPTTKGNSATYFAFWTSSATAPGLVLSTEATYGNGYSPANNMAKGSDNKTIQLYPGAKGCNYVISTVPGYHITAYTATFKFGNGNTGTNTLAFGDKTYSVTAADQTVTVSDVNSPYTSFKLTGDNKPVALTSLTVNLVPTADSLTTGDRNLFVTGYMGWNGKTMAPYRIPALSMTHKGHLLAMSDYRPGGADIGYGTCDIVARISEDNGKTWGKEFAVAKGNGVAGSESYGFGDAALVADATSDSILLVCAAGNVAYPSSTRANPIRIKRLRSNDGGKTWSTPTDITETIYSLLDNSKQGTAKGIFFTSGKIFQSKVIKVGKHYRIYAALCTNPGGNYVVYSDDFGENWAVLGGKDVSAVPGGNEAKCDELFDGTVIISSRVPSSRYFNFFTYTDAAKAQGSWGTVARAAAGASGIAPADGSNGCNGDLLIVPAQRKSDQKDVYVALQTVPFGPARSHVGVYYKELSSPADFSTPAVFASSWDGKVQLTDKESAYSVLSVQPDGKIGLLYEEQTFGIDYTNLYRPYTLEQLTEDKYAYKAAGIDTTAFVKGYARETAVSAIRDNAAYVVGAGLGAYADPSGAYASALAEVKAVAAKDAPSTEECSQAIAKLDQARSALKLNMPSTDGTFLRIRVSAAGQAARPYLAAVNAASGAKTDKSAAFTVKGDDAATIFYLRGDSLTTYADGYRLANTGTAAYVGYDSLKLKATPVVFEAGSAPATYQIKVNAGISGKERYLYCNAANGNYFADVNGNANPAQCRFTLEAVDTLPVSVGASGYATLHAPVALTIPEGVTAYAAVKANDRLMLTAYNGTIPASTPVILQAEEGSYRFPFSSTAEAATLANDLSGTTAAQAKAGNAFILQQPDGQDAGFYPSGRQMLRGWTAYLAADKTSGVSALPFGTQTGLTTAIGTETRQGAAVYDLTGRRLAAPVKGINIIGGHKVIVR